MLGDQALDLCAGLVHGEPGGELGDLLEPGLLLADAGFDETFQHVEQVDHFFFHAAFRRLEPRGLQEVFAVADPCHRLGQGKSSLVKCDSLARSIVEFSL